MTKLPAEADQYGQVHPKETADLISSKLKDLEVELAKIRTEQKTAYEEAKIKCPELLTSDFKLMFLRCEVFNTYVSDWKQVTTLLCGSTLPTLTIITLYNCTEKARCPSSCQVLGKAT